MAKTVQRLYVIIPLASSRSKASSMGDASLAMSMCLEELGYGLSDGSKLALDGSLSMVSDKGALSIPGRTELTLKLSMLEKVTPLAVPIRGSFVDSVVETIKRVLATVEENLDEDSLEEDIDGRHRLSQESQRDSRQGEGCPSGDESFEVELAAEDVPDDDDTSNRRGFNSDVLDDPRWRERSQPYPFPVEDVTNGLTYDNLGGMRSERKSTHEYDSFSFDDSVSMEDPGCSNTFYRSAIQDNSLPHEGDCEDSFSFTSLAKSDEPYCAVRGQAVREELPRSVGNDGDDQDWDDFSDTVPRPSGSQERADCGESSLLFGDGLSKPNHSPSSYNSRIFARDLQGGLTLSGDAHSFSRHEEAHRKADRVRAMVSDFGSLMSSSNEKKSSKPQLPQGSKSKALKFRLSTCPSPGRIRGGLCGTGEVSSRSSRVIRKTDTAAWDLPGSVVSSSSSLSLQSPVSSHTVDSIARNGSMKKRLRNASIEERDASSAFSGMEAASIGEMSFTKGCMDDYMRVPMHKANSLESMTSFSSPPASPVTHVSVKRPRKTESNPRKVSFAQHPTYSVIGSSWEEATEVVDSPDRSARTSHLTMWDDLNSDCGPEGKPAMQLERRSKRFKSQHPPVDRVKGEKASISPGSLHKYRYDPSTVDDITPHDSVSNPGARLHFRYPGISRKSGRGQERGQSWRRKQMPRSAVLRDGLFTVFR